LSTAQLVILASCRLSRHSLSQSRSFCLLPICGTSSYFGFVAIINTMTGSRIIKYLAESFQANPDAEVSGLELQHVLGLDKAEVRRCIAQLAREDLVEWDPLLSNVWLRLTDKGLSLAERSRMRPAAQIGEDLRGGPGRTKPLWTRSPSPPQVSEGTRSPTEDQVEYPTPASAQPSPPPCSETSDMDGPSSWRSSNL
jgi:hypothetical protein